MDNEWALDAIESTALIGSWSLDIERQICTWSKGTYSIHEEDPAKKIELSQAINYYTETHRPIIESHVQRAIEKHEPWDLELQIITTKKNIKWVRATGYPIIKNGKLTSIRGLFQDIDKQKKLIIELAVANEKSNSALKNSQVGLWEWDIKNNILSWDQQMYKLYGIQPDTFSSAYEAWIQGLHPEDRKKGDHEIQMALQGEKDFNTEFRVLWPDGQIKHIRAFATVKRDQSGNPSIMLGTNWDITDEKETLSLLEHQNKELQTVFNAIPGLVIHKRTSDDVMVRVNKYTADLMGTTTEKMNGQPSSRFYDKELCKKYHQDDLEVVNSGQPKLGIIEENHDGRGKRFWLKTDKTPYYDKSGKITGIVLCSFDITAQMITQQELERLNEELSQFTYRTSHDLRAPISTIKGLSSIMLSQLKDEDTPEVEKNLQKVISMCEKLQGLIADLLNLTKSDHIDDPPVVFDLSKEINSIFEFQQMKFKDRRKIIFEHSIQQQQDLVVQEVRLRQVLDNLISNAVKYSDFEDKPSKIKVTVNEKDGACHITVSDNGVGIPEQYHSQVFKIFKRFHHHKEGSGLGLYLCKKHIDLMKGNISFQSSSQGTSFKVSLPAQ